MNDYNYQGSENTEPDYYAQYTELKLKEARGVFSRYHLGLFLYLIIAYAVSLVAEIIMIAAMGYDAFYELIETNIYVNWLFGVGPMYIVAFPCFCLIIKNMRTMPVERSKMSASEFFTLFLVAEAFIFVGSLIGTGFSSFFESLLGKEVADTTSELIESSPMWLVLLITVVVAPIIEELMFRKFMIDRLSRYGSVIAIVVSSIAFGLFHGNFYQFFYATLLGLILGYIYARTRDVRYTMVMHAIINFVGSVAVMPVIDCEEKLLEMTESLATSAEIDLAALDMEEFLRCYMVVGSYSIIQYTLVAAGIVFLIKAIKNRKIKLQDSWEYKIPRERVTSTVLANVGVILFIVMSVLLFAVNILLT